MTDDTVEIFTDGACSGNPGPGGWGALLRFKGVEKELSGADAQTTNNRMEMMGAIVALESLTRPSTVVMTTDSKYVMDGITKWVKGWQARGWKTAAKEPVKNQDLWQRLLLAVKPHQIRWEWVKGHNDHPENERVDQLAVNAIKKLRESGGV